MRSRKLILGCYSFRIKRISNKKFFKKSNMKLKLLKKNKKHIFKIHKINRKLVCSLNKMQLKKRKKLMSN